jgi:hypothetical protein
MEVAQKSACRMSQVAGSDGLASSGVESGDPADSGSFMSLSLVGDSGDRDLLLLARFC